MVNALLQKRVNVINVLTSGTIRVRNDSFYTYDSTGDTPHGRKQQVDYYLSESYITVTLVILHHA